jgi:hypothetical protein
MAAFSSVVAMLQGMEEEEIEGQKQSPKSMWYLKKKHMIILWDDGLI